MDYGNGARRNPPRMRIPEEYRDGLAKLLELPDESFRELLVAIQEERPTLHYADFSARVARKISGIKPNEVQDVIETLVSLYGVRTRWGLEIPELAQIVTQATEWDWESEFSGEERDSFEGRLVLLLGIDSLDATSKALDVLLEHEHTLHDVRIMTDVRPVFGQNADEPPIGTMVVHMLKISYHDESEEVKEFYVALDAGDTRALSAELERADQKAESLKRMLGPTGVPYIDAG